MADDKEKSVLVQQHMRALPGFDESTNRYMSAILDAAKIEGLDEKAAWRVALGFLRVYRPRLFADWEKLGIVANLTT